MQRPAAERRGGGANAVFSWRSRGSQDVSPCQVGGGACPELRQATGLCVARVLPPSSEKGGGTIAGKRLHFFNDVVVLLYVVATKAPPHIVENRTFSPWSRGSPA